MKCPWVSRALFDHVSNQLSDCEAERKQLLAKVLSVPTFPVESQPEEKKTPQRANPVIPFTTPIDRIEQQMDTALKNGGVDAKYRARLR